MDLCDKNEMGTTEVKSGKNTKSCLRESKQMNFLSKTLKDTFGILLIIALSSIGLRDTWRIRSGYKNYEKLQMVKEQETLT